MAMSLTQPVVGSVGWGPAVNLNFQTLQEFCNALPGSLQARLVAGGLEDALDFCAAGVAFNSQVLDAGWINTGLGATPSVILAWYAAAKSVDSPPLLLNLVGGFWEISNGDTGDSSSFVSYLYFAAAPG
jgi:hypothetical protein